MNNLKRCSKLSTFHLGSWQWSTLILAFHKVVGRSALSATHINKICNHWFWDVLQKILKSLSVYWYLGGQEQAQRVINNNKTIFTGCTVHEDDQYVNSGTPYLLRVVRPIWPLLHEPKQGKNDWEVSSGTAAGTTAKRRGEERREQHVYNVFFLFLPVKQLVSW